MSLEAGRIRVIVAALFPIYLNIDTPTEVQDEALYELLRPDYPHRAVGVFAVTGSGKSAITQGAGAVLGGITLYLLPTVALRTR